MNELDRMFYDCLPEMLSVLPVGERKDAFRLVKALDKRGYYVDYCHDWGVKGRRKAKLVE